MKFNLFNWISNSISFEVIEDLIYNNIKISVTKVSVA